MAAKAQPLNQETLNLQPEAANNMPETIKSQLSTDVESQENPGSKQDLDSKSEAATTSV